MGKVVARRSDLNVTINDLSKDATDWATKHFEFTTLTGGADVLAAHSKQYDVVVLSDVLYYEANLTLLRSALSRLIAHGGSIVIRVPNKSALIRLGELCGRLARGAEQTAMQSRIRFFNPEHIFIFRQRYLRNRLLGIGMQRAYVLASPLLASSRLHRLGPTLFQLAHFANCVSGKRLVLTPSMVVVGTGRSSSIIA